MYTYNNNYYTATMQYAAPRAALSGKGQADGGPPYKGQIIKYVAH